MHNDCKTFAPGTVILGTNTPVAVIKSAARRHGIDGYEILDGSTYTRWIPATSVRLAIVGDSVCANPRGACYCGLVHVSADKLQTLPKAEAATE